MNIRQWKDRIAHRLMAFLCFSVLSLILLMGIGLYLRARPVLEMKGWAAVLLSADWHPAQGQFGLLGFMTGTLWVTVVAMLVAVPLSFFTAVFLAEYCPRKIRPVLKPVVDLLAGISPVVYGVWGILVIIPFVRDYVMPFFSEHLPFFPFASENYTGFGILSASMVLAVMVSPLMISIMEEIMRTIPLEMREAALALGATSWQTTKYVVVRKAAVGIAAAMILGFSRAVGETMAVLMVAGCVLHGFPKSIFDPAYPLPALIANTYGEMMSIPLYDAAVLTAAFVLFMITVLMNAGARGFLLYIKGIRK